jgi:beta,beta-carotene 9',10'-dioxygenase
MTTNVNLASTTSVGFEKGFADQRIEIMIDSLDVEGVIPQWLSGSLIRNGPARFHLDDMTLKHWFDGLGMLHKFDIEDGRVGYANRFVDSPALRADADGKMAYAEFATDPCRSLFKRLTQSFTRSPLTGASGNANITTGLIGEQFVAQMETPTPVAFDPHTLDTIGVVDFDDTLEGQVTTAHPQHDPDERAAYNFLLDYGTTSAYSIYRLPDGSTTRELLGRSDTKRPSYVHSLGLSERYVILAEFPLVVNPLRLMVSGKPFIENFRWEPQRGTNFTLFDRRTGTVTHAHTDEAWFGFHHVNAVDRDGQDGVVDVDILVYPTAEVVQHYYLTSLLDRPHHNVYPPSEIRRFTIDAEAGTVNSRTLVAHSSELPRINYDQCNSKPYRYVYSNGIAAQGESVFLDTIIKADVTTGDVQEWRDDNHFPGEPVFVARPEATVEDDGVLLTVVLDAEKNTSYLLILDAHDLAEIARAEVGQHIPFGFHGTYTHRA